MSGPAQTRVARSCSDRHQDRGRSTRGRGNGRKSRPTISGTKSAYCAKSKVTPVAAPAHTLGRFRRKDAARPPCGQWEALLTTPRLASLTRFLTLYVLPSPTATMMETYHGVVRTPGDAIKLFEACRQGLLPRVQRRLSEKERQSIRSGSVFVWDEREAGMRRWTDGKSWSASRVSGSFLTYREMEGKRGGGFGTGRRGGAGKTPDSGRGSDEDQDDGEPDGYRYKADGLLKQSFSITASTGQHLHLISYYARQQPGQPELMQPSNDPSLRHISPAKGMYPESSLNEAPAMTRAPMQTPFVPASQQPHYPTQYGQPGYSWPPSPVATPPYSHGHYTTAPSYPPAQLPQPHHYPHACGGHHYGPAVAQGAQHDRAPLPPPQALAAPVKPAAPLPQPQPSLHGAYSHQPTHHSPHPPHPRIAGLESPLCHHLQAAAQAVLVDPRLSNNANPRLATLPPLGPGAASPTQARGASISPPRSSHSESNSVGGSMHNGHKSLPALLPPPHPGPGSEANGSRQGNNSTHSSPRAKVAAPAAGISGPSRPLVSEDARALGALDKGMFR